MAESPRALPLAGSQVHLQRKNSMTSVALLTLAALQIVAMPPARAAYVRADSEPMLVSDIYANEWGSPFVRFVGPVNSACAWGGNGLYLWNLEAIPNSQFRNSKLALLLTAKASGRRVRLDYYYDVTKAGWEACYVHGLTLLD